MIVPPDGEEKKKQSPKKNQERPKAETHSSTFAFAKNPRALYILHKIFEGPEQKQGKTLDVEEYWI